MDCDKDTLLAKVDQVGAACHTGNRSCFYTTIVGADYDAKNPRQVFESVYNTIEDRKMSRRDSSSKDKGWYLVCVDGYPLGFGKLINQTLTNKYLPGWRWQSA